MPTEHHITMLQNRIAKLQDPIVFLYTHLGITFTTEAAAGDDPRIVDALKKGNLLEAIKVYRELYSSAAVTVSLDEAKRAVEEMKGRLRI